MPQSCVDHILFPSLVVVRARLHVESTLCPNCVDVNSVHPPDVCVTNHEYDCVSPLAFLTPRRKLIPESGYNNISRKHMCSINSFPDPWFSGGIGVQAEIINWFDLGKDYRFDPDFNQYNWFCDAIVQVSVSVRMLNLDGTSWGETVGYTVLNIPVEKQAELVNNVVCCDQNSFNPSYELNHSLMDDPAEIGFYPDINQCVATFKIRVINCELFKSYDYRKSDEIAYIKEPSNPVSRNNSPPVIGPRKRNS